MYRQREGSRTFRSRKEELSSSRKMHLTYTACKFDFDRNHWSKDICLCGCIDTCSHYEFTQISSYVEVNITMVSYQRPLGSAHLGRMSLSPCLSRLLHHRREPRPICDNKTFFNLSYHRCLYPSRDHMRKGKLSLPRTLLRVAVCIGEVQKPYLSDIRMDKGDSLF